MLWLFTGIVMATIFGPTPNITDFKEVEYELSKQLDLSTCSSNLSSIAYAFAVKETWNGNWLKQANKNNLFGLRYGKSTTTKRPKFAVYPVKTYTPNGYNIYSQRRDSIYDMMYHFYKSWCKLTKTYVRGHLNGHNWGWWWVDSYYNTLQWLIKKYDSFGFDYRFMIKPNNSVEFLQQIKTLQDKWFTPSTIFNPIYSVGTTIIVDTRYNKYRVNQR